MMLVARAMPIIGQKPILNPAVTATAKNPVAVKNNISVMLYVLPAVEMNFCTV